MPYSKFEILLDSADGEPATATAIAGWNRLVGHFVPRDRVTGRVVLVLEKDEDIKQVMIRFQGKINTSVPISNDVSESHTHIMFSVEEVLFQGPFKIRAGTHEWPFSFAFPNYFDPNADETPQYAYSTPRSFHPDARFNVEFQPLPPSCGENDTACVSYQLRAKIPRTFEDWKSKSLLRLTPFRAEAVPEPMMLMQQDEKQHHRHYRCDDNSMPRALTTKEILHDRFHKHSPTQTIPFRVGLTAPTCIVTGEPYPILLTLQSEPPPMAVPEFYLLHLKVDLKAHTDIRVPGNSTDHQLTTDERIPLFERDNLACKLSLNQPFTYHGVFPWTTMYIPPSFSTISIRRYYSLTVHATVVCLDEKFKVTLRWHDVVILPSRMEDGGDEAIQKSMKGGVIPPYAMPSELPYPYQPFGYSNAPDNIPPPFGVYRP